MRRLLPHPLLLVAVLLGGVGWTGPARAGAPTIFVEGFTERGAADGHARELRRRGLDASVHRAFTVGEGNAWSVRASVGTEAEARRLARVLALDTGHPHAVLLVDPPARVAAEPARSVQDGRVVRSRLGSAAEVRFVYVRRLADGRRFRHRYLRMDGMEQVRIEDERGVLHVAIRVEQEVAMRAGPDGRWGPTDRFRALEVLDGLRPERVLRPAWARPSASLRVQLQGEVVDASVSIPRLIRVWRNDTFLDHVEIEMLALDPPRAAPVRTPDPAARSIQ